MRILLKATGPVLLLRSETEFRFGEINGDVYLVEISVEVRTSLLKTQQDGEGRHAAPDGSASATFCVEQSCNVLKRFMTRSKERESCSGVK